MIWNTAFSVDLSAELESPQDGANAKLDSPCFLWEGQWRQSTSWKVVWLCWFQALRPFWNCNWQCTFFWSTTTKLTTGSNLNSSFLWSTWIAFSCNSSTESRGSFNKSICVLLSLLMFRFAHLGLETSKDNRAWWGAANSLWKVDINCFRGKCPIRRDSKAQKVTKVPAESCQRHWLPSTWMTFSTKRLCSG